MMLFIPQNIPLSSTKGYPIRYWTVTVRTNYCGMLSLYNTPVSTTNIVIHSQHRCWIPVYLGWLHENCPQPQSRAVAQPVSKWLQFNEDTITLLLKDAPPRFQPKCEF